MTDKTALYNIDTIIWDWNGTLLDDTEICIRSMNQMLAERKMQPITREIYTNHFTFPVRDYYEKIGWDFTKESFDKIGIEFMDHYFSLLPLSPLHIHTKMILERFRQKGYRQTILSAMEHDALELSLRDKGIRPYFDLVQGINNHYANGKLETAQQLLLKIDRDRKSICLIGDTLHDLEVAEQIGCHCVLIANGHQSFARLENTGVLVLKSLSDLEKLC
jgi:phosphoglycolate phosphatase